jgi:hypothetical protein
VPQPTRPAPIYLAAILEQARRLIRRGDGWECADPTRLWRHCAEVGITTEPSITIALRKAFAEITVDQGHVREDTSYEDACKDQLLFEFRWQSPSIGEPMYLKFALFDGRLVIISFHRSKDPRLIKK